jgi:PAS domain S-box-containing protein
MKQRAEVLHNVVELAPDAMLVVDAQGKIVYANKQAERLFAFEQKDLIGASVEQLLPERFRHRHRDHRKQFAAEGRTRPMGVGLELFARRSDGKEFPVEISLSPLDKERNLIAAAIRDVTDRKLVEQQLMRAREAADRANQTKSRFLATASHDLRQPLQAIALLNGTLRRMDLPSKAREALDQQAQSIEAMSRLLNALLDISKLESGAIKPEPIDFRLNSLCESLASEFGRAAAAKGLRLNAEVESVTAHSDPGLVEQILRNLLSNAIKYTPSGSVTFRCYTSDGRSCIDVIDSGVGMSPEQIPLIFDEFYQIGVSTNSTRNGYGLGLSIVQRLVNLLGAELNVQSQLGVGSTFTLRLAPAHKECEAAIPKKATEPAPMAARQERGTVLLVEDDPAVRTATGLLLEMEDYRVITAATSDEALERVREDPSVQVLITDFHLSGVETGLDVVNAIRRVLGRDVPVVLVTGDTSTAVKKLPHDKRLRLASKPINAELLLKLLNELTENVPPEPSCHDDAGEAHASIQSHQPIS